MEKLIGKNLLNGKDILLQMMKADIDKQSEGDAWNKINAALLTSDDSVNRNILDGLYGKKKPAHALSDALLLFYDYITRDRRAKSNIQIVQAIMHNVGEQKIARNERPDAYSRHGLISDVRSLYDIAKGAQEDGKITKPELQQMEVALNKILGKNSIDKNRKRIDYHAFIDKDTTAGDVLNIIHDHWDIYYKSVDVYRLLAGVLSRTKLSYEGLIDIAAAFHRASVEWPAA